MTQMSAPKRLGQTSEWQSALTALATKKGATLSLPVAELAPRLSLAELVRLADTRRQELVTSPVQLHIHFDNHEQTQNVFSAVLAAAASGVFSRPIANMTALNPGVPAFTMAQATAGGAVLGGLGGAGVALLMQGLKATADALGNPLLGTLGFVLLGASLGATSSAVIAKTSEYSMRVTAQGVYVTAGNRPPSAPGK